MNKHKTFMRILLILAINIVVAVSVFFFFFGKQDFSSEQKENGRLIGASYMTMNNEFYKIIGEEVSYRIEAEGDRLILRDPALNPVRQAEQIEDMLDMGISALIVAPADSECLREVLKKAREQGVSIIVVDTAVADGIPADCTITSDNYKAGVLVGEYYLTEHESGELVIMTHESTESARERVAGFVDTISRNENIHIVREIGCEGQVEIAMPKLQEAIDEGLQFDSIFCLNDLASVGVVAALDENGLLDEVDVYGVDASPDSKALIYEGMMDATAAQFPTVIGERAADTLYDLLDGKEVTDILTPVRLITRSNVEEFGISRWQ